MISSKVIRNWKGKLKSILTVKSSFDSNEFINDFIKAIIYIIQNFIIGNP